jgi:hypothetical protein
VAEDAVRSETVSRRDLPAICDLQGDFRKLQGEPSYGLSSFLMVSIAWNELPDPNEQGAFFGIAGRSSVELRMVAGLAQIPLRVDMVYWPTRVPRLFRRDALPPRSSAWHQIPAARQSQCSPRRRSSKRRHGEARRHHPVEEEEARDHLS